MRAVFKQEIYGWAGDARLYEVDSGVEYHAGFDEHDNPITKGASHVIVSAANVPSSGPETYIFPANEDAQVLHWAELEGSYRGGLDHAQALANAGIELVDAF
jgi:hypothetical protein